MDDHLFYDGYKLDNKLIGSPEFVNSLLEEINKHVFDNQGRIELIPYFNGKVKEDGGVSGIILGDGFHFTCHTFSYKNTVFVDYFGEDSRKGKVHEILLDYFDTDDYDMGSKNKAGNFGKHIIIHPPTIPLDEAKRLVYAVMTEIEMTPITDLFINASSQEHFDLLQPIAESHISFHRNNKKMVVDAFSCKSFNVRKFLELFGNGIDYIEVNRGLKYRK